MSQSYHKNTVMTVVTVVAALLAATAVFFLIWKIAAVKQEEAELNNNYQPDAELATEMKIAATDLIKANHEVFTLFFTKGISYQEEPYGAEPEDGFYTGKDSTYQTFEQVEELVRSTYVSTEADRILTNPLGNGPTLGAESDGSLGLSSSFVPMEYQYSWENVSFSIDPISDIECGIKLTISDSAGNSVDLTPKMQKLNGTWLLESVIY